MVLARLAKRRFCLANMMEGALRKLAAVNYIDITHAENKEEIIAILNENKITKKSRPNRKKTVAPPIDIKMMNEELNAPNVMEVTNSLNLGVFEKCHCVKKHPRKVQCKEKHRR